MLIRVASVRYVVIMAGGSGKRLWPLSRQGMPKQLLRLVQGKSLLRMAFERVVDVVGAEQVWVCTGAAYAEVVREELPEMPVANILGEPVGRDSLNAVAWPAAVLEKRDPDAVVAMVTADQLIEPVDVFQDALRRGFEAAEADASALVTFGVVPDRPHTGYGYLHRGDAIGGSDELCEVREFKEKPDLATAQSYVDSGEYWWNAGMFVWRASTFLEQLQQLVPAGHSVVTDIAEQPERIEELFPQLPKISVDYAIMEPVSHGRGADVEGRRAHVVAVRLPITWHDVGGFPALGEHLDRDEHGNAIDGRTLMLDSRENLVINTAGDERLVAVLGLRDTVVVSTPDITLVCPSSEAERIKELVAKAESDHGLKFT